METEIDLRPYFKALLHYWKWIIGAGLLVALVAFSLSFLIPPTYQATALAAIVSPQQRVQFDPRIEAIDNRLPLAVYPELATSNDLLQTLLLEIDPPLNNISSVEALQNIITASPGRDASLLRLSVQHESPTEAARIANMWSEIFIAKANEIYGSQGDSQMQFFEGRMEQTKLELDAAEGALIDFQAQNRTGIISNELDALMQTQADYLATQRAIIFLIQDVEGLRAKLMAQGNNDSITFADQLAGLLIQIKAFNTQFDANTTPILLQVSGAETLTGAGQEDQLAFLDELKIIIDTRSSEMDVKMAELEPRILVLQQEMQVVETENNRLLLNRDVIQETYTALAHKVEEERITSQDVSSGVRLASRAAVPVKSVNPSRLLSTALAGVLGLVLGMLGVFVREWWQVTENLRRQETVGNRHTESDLLNSTGNQPMAYAQPPSGDAD